MYHSSPVKIPFLLISSYCVQLNSSSPTPPAKQDEQEAFATEHRLPRGVDCGSLCFSEVDISSLALTLAIAGSVDDLFDLV